MAAVTYSIEVPPASWFTQPVDSLDEGVRPK
jgi:hypothetical protein